MQRGRTTSLTTQATSFVEGGITNWDMTPERWQKVWDILEQGAQSASQLPGEEDERCKVPGYRKSPHVLR